MLTKNNFKHLMTMPVVLSLILWLCCRSLSSVDKINDTVWINPYYGLGGMPNYYIEIVDGDTILIVEDTHDPRWIDYPEIKTKVEIGFDEGPMKIYYWDCITYWERFLLVPVSGKRLYIMNEDNLNKILEITEIVYTEIGRKDNKFMYEICIFSDEVTIKKDTIISEIPLLRPYYKMLPPSQKLYVVGGDSLKDK